MQYKTSFIDSFSLMVPECLVTYPDFFNEKLLLVNSGTGEIEKEMSKNQEIFLRGSSVFVKKFPIFGKTYLRFFISRKMLPARFYLNRTSDDFRDLLIYGIDFYRSAGYILPDLEMILKEGFINDIDFTVDFLENSETFDFRMNAYKRRNPTGKVYFSVPRKYTEYKKRIGISFGSRDDSKITAPFVKFYSKHLELLDRSTDFFHFLAMEGVGVDPDLRRIEGTIRNRAHLQKVFKKVLKREFYDNRDLFTITEKDCKLIALNLIERHLSIIGVEHQEPRRDKDGKLLPPVTPTDWLLGCMADKLMHSGWTLAQICNFLPVDKYSDTAKSRLNKRIKKGLEFYNIDNGLEELRVTINDAFL